jgi:hypothetical protein
LKLLWALSQGMEGPSSSRLHIVRVPSIDLFSQI